MKPYRPCRAPTRPSRPLQTKSPIDMSRSHRFAYRFASSSDTVSDEMVERKTWRRCATGAQQCDGRRGRCRGSFVYPGHICLPPENWLGEGGTLLGPNFDL